MEDFRAFRRHALAAARDAQVRPLQEAIAAVEAAIAELPAHAENARAAADAIRPLMRRVKRINNAWFATLWTNGEPLFTLLARIRGA